MSIILTLRQSLNFATWAKLNKAVMSFFQIVQIRHLRQDQNKKHVYGKSILGTIYIIYIYYILFPNWNLYDINFISIGVGKIVASFENIEI